MAHLDCQPVGISRGAPRFRTGYAYKKLVELAPDDRTWAEEDWAAFAASYRRQLSELGLDAIVGKLEGISKQAGCAALVLLCFEASPNDCHRGLLASWFEEHGIEVRELRPGMIPERPEAPQPSLF